MSEERARRLSQEATDEAGEKTNPHYTSFRRAQALATAAVAEAILDLAAATREAAPLKMTDRTGILSGGLVPEPECAHEQDPESTARVCKHCGGDMLFL